MAKAPAYQHYAKDWLVGTAHLTLEEQGAYMRLLDYQWDAGSVPKEEGDRAKLLGVSLRTYRRIWKRIGKYFPKGRNRRLEEVRDEQTAYRESQSQHGKMGALKRWHSDPNAVVNGPVTVVPIANDSPASASASASETFKSTTADAVTLEREANPYQRAFRTLLPPIREHLWCGKQPSFKDARSGDPWSEGRECTVIRTLMGRGHSVEDLLELIEGLRILRDYNGLYTDPVSWLTPGCQISLRVLFKAQSGALPVVNLARMAFEKHASRSKRKQSNPEHIGDIVTQLPGAA